jgi:hypothetical protein
MLIRVKVGNELTEVDTSKNTVLYAEGESKYYIDRTTYYLIKGIYGIPRLYGFIKGDPVEGWRQNFERYFIQNLKNELEVAKTWFTASFEIEMRSLLVKGSIQPSSIAAKVELKEKPEIKSSGIQANFDVDSFYFSSLEKLKPKIIPSSRAGLIYAFYKFLVFQYEGAPGIPKAFGIAADFINGMILPQGFSDVINGHKIWVNNEESTVYVDTLPLHNAPSNILSLLALRYYITTATEGDFLIIEDPEAHLSEKEVSEVVSWIKSCKAKMFISTNDSRFGSLVNS